MISAQLPAVDAVARTVVSLRQAKGPIMGLFAGDSLTFGNNDNNAGITGAGSYAGQLCWRSAGRIACRKNIGIPGENSTAIVKRLFDEGLALPGLDVVFLLQGTNDLIQAVAQGTTTANDRKAIRAIHSRGLRAVLIAIPPNDTNGAGANALNAAKRAVALAEGALWIDPWTAIRQAGGTYVGGASSDGIHPNQASCALAAAAILADTTFAALLPVYNPASVLLDAELAAPLFNPDFSTISTSGGNTYPTGYIPGQVGGSGTWSTAVAADPVSGINLCTITAAPGATGGYQLQSNNFSVFALRGRRASFSGRLKVAGMPASGGNVLARVIGNGDAAEGAALRCEPISGLSVDGDGYFYGEFQVPAGATTAAVLILVQSVTDGGCSVSFGELAIRAVNFDGLDIRSRRRPSPVRHISAAYTMTVDDELVLVDASAGAVTITLPDATINQYGFGSYSSFYQRRTPSSGLSYTIVKIDGSANAVTVQRAGSNMIEGATSVSLAAQWDKVKLIAAKANLFVKG